MTTSPINIKKDYQGAQIEKVLQLENVSKKYPTLKQGEGLFNDFWALRDISLDVYKGEIVGIIGRNGAGKTTLLNVMAQVLSVTEGEVIIKARVLGLFNLGVGFQDALTGRENIFLNGAILGAAKRELEGRLDSILEFSELGRFIDMPLGTYSQGMRLRLAFSIVINLEFGILVIDEALAVGDVLFQSKCFERLMDFKRSGKTLVITSQSVDLIERLCDRVVLLDHGKILFRGEPPEAINRYRLLLNTEKFCVDNGSTREALVENTKKWADDISHWGKELGTKEVIIEKVEFLNRFGMRVSRVKSGARLKIKVHFTARNAIKDPHFGIAIFREDGVYCYGPNTQFDGCKIPELNQGSGYFILDYHNLLLAPGEYRISVAIWDKNETLPFNYHEGCYPLVIVGHNNNNSLLNILVIPGWKCNLNTKIPSGAQDDIDNQLIKLGSVKLFSSLGAEKKVFLTNEPVKVRIVFNDLKTPDRKCFLWIGIYRDDNIYCQGFYIPINGKLSFEWLFPKLPLLPGGYRISFGIWDRDQQDFIMCHHEIYPFRMVFNREDHGTVYLEHEWNWAFR